MVAQTGKECECEELRLRRSSPLVCEVMGFAACSSWMKLSGLSLIEAVFRKFVR